MEFHNDDQNFAVFLLFVKIEFDHFNQTPGIKKGFDLSIEQFNMLFMIITLFRATTKIVWINCQKANIRKKRVNSVVTTSLDV